MKIQDILKHKTSEIVNNLYGSEIIPSDIQIQLTSADYEGDFTIVVFPLTKVSRKSPQETCVELGEALIGANPEVEKYEVVKGFLNLLLSQKFWLNYASELSKSSELIWEKSSKPRKIMVEYSSPNTNKPLHLGHVRNNLLGYSLAEILKARGHEVIKTSLINDRGIHICKSMLAWMIWGDGETPESSGMKGDHLVGKYYVVFDLHQREEIKTLVEGGMKEEEATKKTPLILEAQALLLRWEQGDAETIRIWKMMNEWVYAGFDSTYKSLGVNFDRFYYESQTYLLGKDIVQQGLENKAFNKRADGSVWIDLTPDGLDEKLVLRADGTSVYITQDLGTATQRFDEYKIDDLIYVVGNEQDYHFKVLQLIFKRLGVSWWQHLHHLSYGMVELPEGKMKSREGKVVDADDLIKEMLDTAEAKTREQGKIEGLTEQEQTELFRKIGLAALKFFLLKVDPKKKMLFNPAESIDFHGFTGPFVQYAYARIKSILRKAENIGNWQENISFEGINLHNAEKGVLQLLYQRNDALKEAEEAQNPAALATFAFELAKTYNKFYQECSVLAEPNEQIRNFRLLLSLKTSQCIMESMTLLGIEMVERM